MCFHIQCPSCRGSMTEGLFRMPSFGELPDPEDWIRLMREGDRHVKCGMSETNFMKLLAHLRAFADRDDFFLPLLLPRCVGKYLDDAGEDKRADWCNALRTTATNLACEKLYGDVPIQRNGYKTSYPAEDIVWSVVQRDAYYDNDDENTPLHFFFSEEDIDGLSTIDPPDGDDEDGDDGGGGSECAEGGRSVRPRRETTSTLYEVMNSVTDDSDADFLWDVDPDTFKYSAEHQDYVFKGGFGMPDAVVTYGQYMAVSAHMDMMNFHPDCWFIHCRDGVRTKPEGDEGAVGQKEGNV